MLLQDFDRSIYLLLEDALVSKKHLPPYDDTQSGDMREDEKEKIKNNASLVLIELLSTTRGAIRGEILANSIITIGGL